MNYCIECDTKLGTESEPIIIHMKLRHLSGDKLPEVYMCWTCWYDKGFNLRYTAGGWLVNDTYKPASRVFKGRRPVSLK